MFEQLLAEVFKRLNSSRRAVFKQVFEQRLNVKPGSLGRSQFLRAHLLVDGEKSMFGLVRGGTGGRGTCI